MKLGSVKLFGKNSTSFEGKRISHNAVSQLANSNDYSLSEPNQRYITNAIKELSNVKGSKNINFLLDTAAKSTYSTNIVLKDMPKHNWKSMLIAAAVAAASLTKVLPKYLQEKLQKADQTQKLTNDEKAILQYRNEILSKVDLFLFDPRN